MKAHLVTAVMLLAAVASPAAESKTAAGAAVPPEKAAFQSLAQTAQEQLAGATEVLNALREQIAAEKVPLSEELGKWEEQLTQRRRTLDEAQRRVDAGAIEMVARKAEKQAREDELTYIGGLFDEYARAWETKTSVSEQQALASALAAAKQAPENPTLSRDDRFARQVAFLELTCARVADAVGGMRISGAAVGPDGTVEHGLFLVVGPSVMFSSTNGTLTGAVIPQVGSAMPLVRALEGETQAGLGALIAGGRGSLPLDPSRGGALKAMVHEFDVLHVFEQGGHIMWPLLLAAVLAVLTVIERLIFLGLERGRRNPRAVLRFLEAVGESDYDQALALGKKSRFFVLRALTYALEHREKSVSNALLYAQSREMRRYRRGIPVLDTVITLAPLLGLLGTVTGMMGSFALIGGELSAPGAITGGIAEALIATAFGLGIAITGLIPFNMLNARMEEARQELEAAAIQLELLVNRPTGAVEALAKHRH